jgi:acylphosphatase
MTRMHVVVRGRVQGVGFRWFVRETARDARLAGWVRNRQDGAVELEVEGSPAALDAFRATIARGPDGAVVSSIDDLAATTETLSQPFTIIR